MQSTDRAKRDCYRYSQTTRQVHTDPQGKLAVIAMQCNPPVVARRDRWLNFACGAGPWPRHVASCAKCPAREIHIMIIPDKQATNYLNPA